VIRLLAERREQPPYEVRQRRVIELLHRRSLDAALYSYATPDFILSTAQALGDSRLGVSGGEEVMVTLYPEGERFAPLYVWSRSVRPGARRWASAVGRDLAVGRRDLVLARVGDGGEAVGNVYFAPPWPQPEVRGSTVLATYGDTLVALVTAGEWDVAPAPQRLPQIYGGDKNYRGSWVAAPKRQPAAVALRVARLSEVGDLAAWRESAAAARLRVTDDGVLHYEENGRPEAVYDIGSSARIAGEAVSLPPEGVQLSSPFLDGREGRWTFAYGGETKALAVAPE
jgi:hypothetical protein